MTAEEYIVEKLKEQEKSINDMQDLICMKDAEISRRNQMLELLVSLFNYTETKSDGYYELTVWKSDRKGLFEKVESIVEEFKKEKNNG